MSLLKFTSKGIFCPQANVYLDPWKPVGKAIISHAHADHARWGMKNYLCHNLSKNIIKHRLKTEHVESLPYNKTVNINGVKFSFHPAGHIIGSAQIKVEYKGEISVFTGDYKVKKDGLVQPFEPVKCHTLITESTFGLPVYKWEDETILKEKINNWWKQNNENGITSIILGYSLGKAQRILHAADPSIGPIYTHGAVENINEILRQDGVQLTATARVSKDISNDQYKGALIICPPSSLGTPWMKKFRPYKTAICSGWMAIRGARRRRNVDTGFVMSDHADWDDLNYAVKASEAEKVYVTHGYSEIYAQWLNEHNINAEPLVTEYEGELSEIGEGNTLKEEI